MTDNRTIGKPDPNRKNASDCRLASDSSVFVNPRAFKNVVPYTRSACGVVKRNLPLLRLPGPLISIHALCACKTYSRFNPLPVVVLLLSLHAERSTTITFRLTTISFRMYTRTAANSQQSHWNSGQVVLLLCLRVYLYVYTYIYVHVHILCICVQQPREAFNLNVDTPSERHACLLLFP